MKKLNAFITIIIFSFVFSSCTFFSFNDESFYITSTDNDEKEALNFEMYGYEYEKPLECLFYDENSFNISVSSGKSYDTEGETLTGIIPHHLLAGNMIANFFKTVSEKSTDIETVVLVAPIHLNQQNKMATTYSDWATPTGVLNCEKDFAERFKNELGAVPDNDLLREDHSASSLIPYIKYYLPDVSVSCLLISSFADDIAIRNTANLFKELTEVKKCLFVFSVDFSHYLVPDETDKMDRITMEAVLSGNIEMISKMGDSNMDSPNCVIAFLRLNELLNYNTTKLDHSNSLKISGLPYNQDSFSEGLTSYFVFSGNN